MLTYLYVHPVNDWTQVSHGTVRSSPERRTQMTKGTGLKSNYFRSKSMAQVTYRGVKYDTNNKKSQQKKEVELTYRGIAHAK